MTDRDAPEVASATSGATPPLTLVSRLAGADPMQAAASAHAALGAPVAIAAIGGAVIWPPEDLDEDERSWLQTAAEGAAAALMFHGGEKPTEKAVLEDVRAGRAADLPAILDRASRLGFDLRSGAVGLCAAGGDTAGLELGGTAMITRVGGRLCGLVPLASGSPDGTAERLAAELADRGLDVALSAPRRDPAQLHEALREAELLIELISVEGAAFDGLQDTYRLLIGVLLRDPHELERLRAQTISPLVVYDHEHETELVATLQAFLAHDGSTTDTAESMQLHRHTVGYRLARVQEVSGLSPYESDGRERLSLGLKAHHIIEAAERYARA